MTEGRPTSSAFGSKPATGMPCVTLLYLARGLRGFGDGFAIIVLPAYMTALGYDAAAVGLVATASLLEVCLLQAVRATAIAAAA